MPHHFTAFAWRRPLAAAFSGLLLVSAAAHAELADKDKPMNIEADSLRYDDKSQTSVFSGNVLVTKGTIIMRGGEIKIRQDEKGNQFGDLVGNNKGPGFFRQKREGVDEWVEGEGDTVIYNSEKQTVVLKGNAKLRRYLGTQLNDQNEGNEIVYNSLTEVFTVTGGPNNTSVENPTGRVRAMLTPVPKDEAAAPQPPADGAKLRPSNKIGEQRK
ncbi:MAG: lipopolysaccharide transport periplasmic protein LptA [Burkholderiaceae bacterium]